MLLILALTLALALKAFAGCLDCHRNHVVNHPGVKDCKSCHVPLKTKTDGAHGLLPDPGDLEAPVVCGGCHGDWVEKIKGSPMALALREINYTRFEWGAQKGPTFLYAVRAFGGFKKIPSYEESGQLVDDFLRKKCLWCHLYAETPERPKGCGACHMDKSRHRLILKPGTKECLRCHGLFNRVGQDFVGLYERDYNRVYALFSGTRFHKLTPDIHYEKGLSCTDCHRMKNLLEGGGSTTCTDCHSIPESPVHKRHKKLRCSACHAAWSFQDYGLYVIRYNDPDWLNWKDLVYQPDPQMLLLARMESNSMRDWIDGKIKKGVWFIGWLYRDWSTPPLGLDGKNKVCIIRPNFQFRLSYVGDNRVIVDARNLGNYVSCYDPHTISARGRNCCQCHGNLKAMGYGYARVFSTGKIEYIFESGDVRLLEARGIKGRPLSKEVLSKLKGRCLP